MTDDTEALIKELRMPEYSPHALQHRAADALEAQAKRITELEAERDRFKYRAAAWFHAEEAVGKAEAERDALAAQIAEARALLAPPHDGDASQAAYQRLSAPASDSLNRVRAEADRIEGSTPDHANGSGA